MNRIYKVLVLCPPFDTVGGVATYYTLFNKYFISDKIMIEYYFVGRKSEIVGLGDRVVNSMIDLLSLCRTIPKYDLVHLNPSLDPKAIIRDGVYHFIAKRIYGKKTIVFLSMGNIIMKVVKILFQMIIFLENCKNNSL